MRHLPLCQFRFIYGVDQVDYVIRSTLERYFSTLINESTKDIDRIGIVDYLKDWLNAMIRHYSRHERLHTDQYAEYNTETTLPGMHISAHLVIIMP